MSVVVWTGLKSSSLYVILILEPTKSQITDAFFHGRCVFKELPTILKRELLVLTSNYEIPIRPYDLLRSNGQRYTGVQIFHCHCLRIKTYGYVQFPLILGVRLLLHQTRSRNDGRSHRVPFLEFYYGRRKRLTGGIYQGTSDPLSLWFSVPTVNVVFSVREPSRRRKEGNDMVLEDPQCPSRSMVTEVVCPRKKSLRSKL